MKNHILWPPEREKKKKKKFPHVVIWKYAAKYFMFFNGKVRFWSVDGILYKNCWVKNKDTILLTNHFDSGWKENSLKIDLRSGAAFRENCYHFNEITAAPNHFLRLDRNRKPRLKSLWNPGFPKTIISFWLDHLVGKSSFKRGTEVFSFYIISEMFRTNELSADLVAASCVLIT